VIDPRAVVDPGARLADGVKVGPFAVIGPDVEIEAGTEIGAHAIVEGPTVIGRDNRIFPYASVGLAPQDKKYAGEPTRLVIGDGNTIREFCTLNRGTAQDRGETTLGDDNWIMAYVHIAHDCVIGDHTILANNVTLGGHVTLGDWVIMGGFSGAHQFCTIGAHAFLQYGSLLSGDVPPFVMVGGAGPRPRGLNIEGLRRRGFDADRRTVLKRAYRILYREGLRLEEAQERIGDMAADNEDVALLARFLEEHSRSLLR